MKLPTRDNLLIDSLGSLKKAQHFILPGQVEGVCLTAEVLQILRFTDTGYVYVAYVVTK